MRFHHRGLRVDFPDFLDDFLFFLFCDLITLGKHKYIRPLHTVQWFSEKSSRQQMPSPKRICAVDKHYVQVSAQPPVLKSIIQKKNICSHGYGFFSGGITILSHQNRHMRHFDSHHIRFIPCFFRRKQNLVPVRYDAAVFFQLSPITPGQYSRSVSRLLQHPCQTDDTRGLPCSPCGHIAYTDNRNRNRFRSGHFLLPPGNHTTSV